MIDRDAVARAIWQITRGVIEGPWEQASGLARTACLWKADAAIAAVMEQLREPSALLRDLVGQVEQARDGFGIWPYAGSESMKSTLKQANAFLQQPTRASEGHGHDTEEPERAD